MQPKWEFKGRIPVDAECLICHRPAECRHHVFPASNRENSEREGCWVYLCNDCHNMTLHSVHMDKRLDKELRRRCQAAYEAKHGHDRFVAVFGASWI